MNHQKELENLILTIAREHASDLHISAGQRPTIRVSGSLIPLLKREVLSAGDVSKFAELLMTPDKLKIFLDTKEIDFSYQFQDGIRFRGNAFYQRGLIGIALRLIPSSIKTVAELNLPPILESFTRRKQGFFLTVGPVGQGKSTTLASMIEMINKEKAVHILTIEDPIEYLFEPKKSLVDQREVSIDTKSFPVALRAAFRQDADVMMIGEMRAHETISTAVTAAETGHLVLSTLHTNTAAQTIDRIIDSFPAEQQRQISRQLASSLIGVLSQRLIQRVSGGLVPAVELLINNNAVASLIREGRTHEINVLIETGSQHGMIDMNRSLADLVRRGEITQENAYLYSFNAKALEKFL